MQLGFFLTIKMNFISEENIMKKLLLSALLAGIVLGASAETSFARDLGDAWSKERFQLRARGIAVIPDDDSSVSVIGGETDVSTEFVPEIDITYFFTENIAAELIAATAKHEIDHNTVGDLGSAWILPPTLTLQYHFTPDKQFSPYLGAGINYSLFYGEDEATGINDLDVDGGFGYALQAGADYWLNDNWGLNLDVKKVFLNIDGTVNNAIKADIDLDPWIVGAGVSYRF